MSCYLNWRIGRQIENKLLDTEMGCWRKEARESRKEKISNLKIRNNYECPTNIIEEIEKRRQR